jgi:hypothetical protein
MRCIYYYVSYRIKVMLVVKFHVDCSRSYQCALWTELNLIWFDLGFNYLKTFSEGNILWKVYRALFLVCIFLSVSS